MDALLEAKAAGASAAHGGVAMDLCPFSPVSQADLAGAWRAGHVEQKALGRSGWDEHAHPRDRKGRFIETGATVSVWGGASGVVLRNVGHGRIEIQRADGKIVRVHRNYLTVTARPDGGKPTSKQEDAPAATPVRAASVDVAGGGDEDPDLVAARDYGLRLNVGPSGLIRVDRLPETAGGMSKPAGTLVLDPDGTYRGSKPRVDAGAGVDVSFPDLDAALSYLSGRPERVRLPEPEPEVDLEGLRLPESAQTGQPTPDAARAGSERLREDLAVFEALMPPLSPAPISPASVRLSQTAPWNTNLRNTYRTRFALVRGRYFRVDADSLDSLWTVAECDVDGKTYSVREGAGPLLTSADLIDVGQTSFESNLGDARQAIAWMASDLDVDGEKQALSEAERRERRASLQALGIDVAALSPADDDGPLQPGAAFEYDPSMAMPSPAGDEFEQGDLFSLFDEGAEVAVEDAGAAAAGEPRTEREDQAAHGPAREVIDIEPARSEFEFPAWRLDEAVASIDKANRRAERAGIAERIGYSVERFTRDRPNPITGVTEYEERARVTIDRPQVKVDGWTFVGTMSWDEESGLITRMVEGATLNARPEARRCDVCKSSRDRRDTYIVQDESGAEQQVGSNCLVQFLGIRPNALWMLDYEPEIKEGDDEEGSGGYGSSRQMRVGTLQSLAATIVVVQARGWMSRSAVAQGVKGVPTADLVMDVLGGSGNRDREYQAFLSEMRAAINEHLEDAASLRDFARTMDGDSEYATNLRALANSETVEYRNLPLLASAIATKQVRDEQAARRAAEAAAGAESEYLGEVGAKVTGLDARVTGVRHMENDYSRYGGQKTLLTLVTEDGAVVKWWASSFQDYDIGDEVTLTAKVKKHGEYRGVKETTVERAKIALSAAGAKAKADAEAAREAANTAAREAADAERKRRFEATPEGFTAVDHASGVVLEPGTRVRTQVPGTGVHSRSAQFQDAVVVESYAIPGGSPPAHVLYGLADEGLDVQQVVSMAVVGQAPSSDDSRSLATLAGDNQRTPIGFARRPGSVTDLIADLAVGDEMRILNPDPARGLHSNVEFVSASGVRLIGRYPDGSEVEVPGLSVVGYRKAALRPGGSGVNTSRESREAERAAGNDAAADRASDRSVMDEAAAARGLTLEHMVTGNIKVSRLVDGGGFASVGTVKRVAEGSPFRARKTTDEAGGEVGVDSFEAALEHLAAPREDLAGLDRAALEQRLSRLMLSRDAARKRQRTARGPTAMQSAARSERRNDEGIAEVQAALAALPEAGEGALIRYSDAHRGDVLRLRKEPDPVTVLNVMAQSRRVGGIFVPETTIYYQRADGSRGNSKANSGTDARRVSRGDGAQDVAGAGDSQAAETATPPPAPVRIRLGSASLRALYDRMQAGMRDNRADDARAARIALIGALAADSPTMDAVAADVVREFDTWAQGGAVPGGATAAPGDVGLGEPATLNRYVPAAREPVVDRESPEFDGESTLASQNGALAATRRAEASGSAADHRAAMTAHNQADRYPGTDHAFHFERARAHENEWRRLTVTPARQRAYEAARAEAEAAEAGEARGAVRAHERARVAAVEIGDEDAQAFHLAAKERMREAARDGAPQAGADANAGGTSTVADTSATPPARPRKPMGPMMLRTLTAVNATGLGHGGTESGMNTTRAQEAGFIELVSTNPVRWRLTPAGEDALRAETGGADQAGGAEAPRAGSTEGSVDGGSVSGMSDEDLAAEADRLRRIPNVTASDGPATVGPKLERYEAAQARLALVTGERDRREMAAAEAEGRGEEVLRARLRKANTGLGTDRLSRRRTMLLRQVEAAEGKADAAPGSKAARRRARHLALELDEVEKMLRFPDSSRRWKEPAGDSDANGVYAGGMTSTDAGTPAKTTTSPPATPVRLRLGSAGWRASYDRMQRAMRDGRASDARDARDELVGSLANDRGMARVAADVVAEFDAWEQSTGGVAEQVQAARPPLAPGTYRNGLGATLTVRPDGTGEAVPPNGPAEQWTVEEVLAERFSDDYVLVEAAAQGGDADEIGGAIQEAGDAEAADAPGEVEPAGLYASLVVAAAPRAVPVRRASEIPDLGSATPVAVDTIISDLVDAYYAGRDEVTMLQGYAINQAGGRRSGTRDSGFGKPTPVMSSAEAIAVLEAKVATDGTRRYSDGAAAHSLLERLANAQALRDAQEAEWNLLEAEFTRRGGWSRAFLVLNTGGHVHSSTNCSTTFPTTRWGWLPEYSGHGEAEIVDAAGSDACTVCFPTAPVVSLSKPRTALHASEKVAGEARAERERKRAEKAAAKAARALEVDLSSFGLSGSDARIETLAAAKAWLTDYYQWMAIYSEPGARRDRDHHPSYPPEAAAAIAAAIAAKVGGTAADEMAAAQKRAAKRR